MFKLSRFIGDLVFPHCCCGCQALGTLLCDHCRQKLDWMMWPVHVEVETNYLDNVWAGYEYNALAKAIVRRCKFDHVVATAELMAWLCFQVINFPSADCLCPVPLHTKRLQERGFNQAAELAQRIGQYINLPVRNLLTRRIHSTQQAKSVDRTERLNKLAGHFTISSEAMKELGQLNSVILIDDVVTTGSTLNECAKVVKSAGVARVYGVTFAHGL